MESIKVRVCLLSHGKNLPLPKYETSGSAGMDLLAAVEEPVVLHPGQIVLIPTGLSVAIPLGYEGQIRPRSGLAFKHGITVPNAPGTIDSDYRGEIKIIVQNTGMEEFKVERGLRIAQIVFCPVVRANWETVEKLPDTDRGEGGFGSTGQ